MELLDKGGIKLHIIKVGSNLVSLVSQAYLADTYRDGRLPAAYTDAPFLVLGGEGFYAMPVDQEAHSLLPDDAENWVAAEEYWEPVSEESGLSAEELLQLTDALNAIADMEQDKADAMKSTGYEMEADLEATIGPEALKEYRRIKEQYDGLAQAVASSYDEELSKLEAFAKDLVVKAGATVKAEKMTGVYNGGRVGWNTKGLDGYAMAHPIIRSFRSTGKPYASLRRVK